MQGSKQKRAQMPREESSMPRRESSMPKYMAKTTEKEFIDSLENQEQETKKAK